LVPDKELGAVGKDSIIVSIEMNVTENQTKASKIKHHHNYKAKANINPIKHLQMFQDKSKHFISLQTKDRVIVIKYVT